MRQDKSQETVHLGNDMIVIYMKIVWRSRKSVFQRREVNRGGWKDDGSTTIHCGELFRRAQATGRWAGTNYMKPEVQLKSSGLTWLTLKQTDTWERRHWYSAVKMYTYCLFWTWNQCYSCVGMVNNHLESLGEGRKLPRLGAARSLSTTEETRTVQARQASGKPRTQSWKFESLNFEVFGAIPPV